MRIEAKKWRAFSMDLIWCAALFGGASAGWAEEPSAWQRIAPFFDPPAEYEGKLGEFRSPLRFEDGSPVRSVEDWRRRREEILRGWHELMGPWPPLIASPKVEYLQETRRGALTQHQVRVEIARGQSVGGYLLVPDGPGPFPGVVVPYYEPETSIGLGKPLRDFAYRLALRGFVTLSIGSPGGDAREPATGQAVCQPLSFLAYVAANCHTVLARLEYVDASRIGIVGHSYGGKWAMFASCLDERFACAAWSDGGVVFDESRSNVNYWDRWYLGAEKGARRAPGRVTEANPRTGAYKRMREKGRDLHELHALMAPRPFLVSGGSEDRPDRWEALNHAVAVNALLGRHQRVGLTSREGHDPTEKSNEQIYAFFEHFLNTPGASQ